MKYVPIEKAQSELSGLFKESLSETVGIVRDGETVGVLMDFAEYQDMQTLFYLATDTERWNKIISAHEKIQSGNLEDIGELKLMPRQ